MSDLKECIISIARQNGADIIKFSSAARFDKEDPLFHIFPETNTVIGLAFRVLRGAYRGIEEGSTFYQYSTMGVEALEETVMPMALWRVSNLLEEEGWLAVPQRRHQQIMAEENSTNPEMVFQTIYRGNTTEIQMDFPQTAVRCGLGELGMHGALLTDDFGPMVRYCFLLTDAVLEEDPLPEPHLCDGCRKCIDACPGHAIAADGTLDPWQCAVYYSGANGTRNPFMPPNALMELEDRMELLSGDARMTPDSARKILPMLTFYPSISHGYKSSVCGRACDTACYIHLEEQNKLTRRFHTPFRKREPWAFPLEQYRKK